MSFDINSPSNKPIIRETASMQNDGGSGNLGYFERENSEKKHKAESIFSNEKESDTFSKEGDSKEENEEFSISKWIAGIIFAVKEWFKKLIK